MPDSIMYQEEMFVVLESDQPEQFLTPEELFDKLKSLVQNYPDRLPRALENLPSLGEKVQYLRDNFCDLEMEGNHYLQWYVVRLEK